MICTFCFAVYQLNIDITSNQVICYSNKMSFRKKGIKDCKWTGKKGKVGSPSISVKIVQQQNSK